MSNERASEVVMNEHLHRFETTADGHTAFLRYRKERDRLILIHTQVPEALEGRGLGTVLARAALEYARANDLTVVPICPFVKAFLERHQNEAAGLTIAPH